MTACAHLKWLAMGLVAGFLVPFLFADVLSLPLDLYYLAYFLLAGAFLAVYVKRTALNVREWASRRLAWGLVFGLAFGALMVRFVLTNPATPGPSGPALAWALLWRGVAYGTVDGLLLTVFPWVVTWRAFRVEERPWTGKIAFGLLAWVFIAAMTTAYHAGYAEFRSRKMTKPLVGNTLISLPTLLSANPVGAPVTHAMMHAAAVLHCSGTDVLLPPHRD